MSKVIEIINKAIELAKYYGLKQFSLTLEDLEKTQKELEAFNVVKEKLDLGVLDFNEQLQYNVADECCYYSVELTPDEYKLIKEVLG